MNTNEISDSWRLGWRRRDTRPIYESAGETVILSAPLTITGKFNVQLSRHFIEPFDALQNHRVREVNVLMPPREGKTMISDMWLWWLIRHNPGPFRWVFQDEKAAEDHETMRTKRNLMSDPIIAPHVPLKGRITNILGMDIAIDGPALGNLQSRGYQFMSLDEVWRWIEGRMAEAKARQGDFAKLQNNKLLVISQGGTPASDWDNQFHAGIIHERNLQCQECGKYFEQMFEGFRSDGTKWGMTWDEKKDAQGFWDVAKCVPTARYTCPHCGGVHVDTPRLKGNWNLTGKYIAEQTDKRDSRVSFRSTGILSWNHQELLELYLRAANQLKTGSTMAMIQFRQKQMADFADEQTIFQAAKTFHVAPVEIQSDWADEDGRLMTIDSQQEGEFYVTVRQWSRRARKTRRLFRGVAYGESSLIEIQQRFAVKPNHVLLDSGFKAKGVGGAYAMAIRNGWLCTKGVGTIEGKASPELTRTIRQKNGRSIRVQSSYCDLSWGDSDTGITQRAPLQRFDSDQISDTLDGLIESGFWVEPVDDGSVEEKEYRFQMGAEFKKPKVDTFSGREISKRVCPTGRNHFYDCAKLQVLGAIMMGWISDPMDLRTASERANELTPAK